MLERSARKFFCWFQTRAIKGKRANLKTGVSRKQSTPNFPKKQIFLTPAYKGVRDDRLFWKIWRALFSWNTRFGVCTFPYYRHLRVEIENVENLYFWDYLESQQIITNLNSMNKLVRCVCKLVKSAMHWQESSHS